MRYTMRRRYRVQLVGKSWRMRMMRKRTNRSTRRKTRRTTRTKMTMLFTS